MPLNEKQQKLVENNMGLVGTVIKENVKNVNRIGIFTYQDIFQIGCEGLSKAAMNYESSRSEFSTCAYIYIRNEIFRALEYATSRRNKEIITDVEDIFDLLPAQDDIENIPSGLDDMLDTARMRAKGIAAKGIDAIRLMAAGYTCREIGELMGNVSANNVTAWISKAREFLSVDPDKAALRDNI